MLGSSPPGERHTTTQVGERQRAERHGRAADAAAAGDAAELELPLDPLSGAAAAGAQVRFCRDQVVRYR